ncbi:hypothetical protein ACLOJK_036820 [Asimina triloba]
MNRLLNLQVQVYEKLTGVAIEGKLPELRKANLLNSLEPEWPEDPFNYIHQMEANSSSKVLVNLDDDRTGTQTVHDIEVLAEWNVESLVEQVSKRPTCFFIEFREGKNIDIAAKSVENIGYIAVLRGDSTLRGHFPEEADAAVSVLGEMDSWIVCPFFLQGGRYTIEYVHYVTDGDRDCYLYLWAVNLAVLLDLQMPTFLMEIGLFGRLVPAGETWIEEKTKGRVPATSVATISIELLRKQGPTAVCEQLCNLQQFLGYPHGVVREKVIRVS